MVTRMSLHPYQQRVLDERTELKSNIDKLKAFLQADGFRSLSPVDRELLVKQAVVMEIYRDVLDQRIALFLAVEV